MPSVPSAKQTLNWHGPDRFRKGDRRVVQQTHCRWMIRLRGWSAHSCQRLGSSGCSFNWNSVSALIHINRYPFCGTALANVPARLGQVL